MEHPTGGYNPKDLSFGVDGRRRLINGIGKISRAVKSTLGPGGNTVLIESPHHTHGLTVTKDGVTVAKAVDLLDPVEHLAVRMMKEAADKTAVSAGDGTTTSIVLTEALVDAGDAALSGYPLNRTVVLRELGAMSSEVTSRLRKGGRRVNRKIMRDVAAISANNDRRIGDLVAGVYAEIGKDGIVTIEKSQTVDTYTEVTHGFKVGRGYMSGLFINDHKRDECVYEDVRVLVCDAEIHNLLQIEQVLKPVIAEGKRLLIIAPCSANVVNTLAANVMKNNLKVVAIEPPSFGYKKHELMQDIALAVGAKYYSEKTGDDLSLMTFGDLGHAAKVVVSQRETIIVNSELLTDKAAVEERVSQLRGAHRLAARKTDKDFILSRIAALTGGVGVIYVGGATDLEQKELFDRVDDAVCAVRAASEEGVLPGGGKALWEAAGWLSGRDCGGVLERMAARDILCHALKAPLRQILENSGLSECDIYDEHVDGYGYDVKAGVYGDLVAMGIVDPVKVTCSALQNAVSVATTILSTDVIITMARA
jgi:chaperonin GroEL